VRFWFESTRGNEKWVKLALGHFFPVTDKPLPRTFRTKARSPFLVATTCVVGLDRFVRGNNAENWSLYAAWSSSVSRSQRTRTMKQVEKLSMAVEQLEDALLAYFDRRFHSAIVLAGAAEQLLAGYVMKHGLTPTFPQMRTAITKLSHGPKTLDGSGGARTTEKDIGDLINQAYNNSKHAGTSDHTVWMNPKFEAQEIIDRAISNYDAVAWHSKYGLTYLPLAQQFKVEPLDDDSLEPDD
jgi:hypothetical protein